MVDEECETPHQLNVTVPLSAYVRDERFRPGGEAPIADLSLVLPCCRGWQALHMGSLVAFVVGILPTSTTELEEDPGLCFEGVAAHEAVDSLCAESLVADVTCNFPAEGMAMAAIADLERKRKWGLEDY